MSTILIVDDEPNIRRSLTDAFQLEGFRCLSAPDGGRALDTLAAVPVDLVILDLQMPGIDGVETLRRLRDAGHAMPVMILSAHGTIERAVEAIRLGAFDFVEKPPHAERILLTARNALRQATLEEENRELRESAGARYRMVGDAPSMQALYERIRRVAPTHARVLILGENGTGKELVARAIHAESPRRARPFVGVNCAAIPRDLFESELFGHERGAFTGATARRRGKFVRADGGTLFLDEVGEIPLELQPKILRALEAGRIEAVGGDREVEVDVRVIAATNRDLPADVARGRFREDLYYRLEGVSLTVPPLRERAADVPALVEHFLHASCAEHNLKPRTIAPDAVGRLRAHPWPGNVRELRNLVERMVILTERDRIELRDVEEALPARGGGSASGRSAGGPAGRPLKEILEATERQAIEDALRRHGGTMAAAARELGLERSHLYKKARALGVRRPGDGDD
jgi:DNA-binding NtrC family response regulator